MGPPTPSIIYENHLNTADMNCPRILWIAIVVAKGGKILLEGQPTLDVKSALQALLDKTARLVHHKRCSGARLDDGRAHRYDLDSRLSSAAYLQLEVDALRD
jgi:hypothetical protein